MSDLTPAEANPEDPRSAYKDVLGRSRTQSLFWEHKDPGYPAFFTLKDDDHTDPDGNRYISLRRLFVACEDPTEYTFAMRAFGSWRHWVRIRGLQWFQPFYQDWRSELETRLRSIGNQQLLAASRAEDTKISVTAARYLANGEFAPALKKRGRPTKEEIEGERIRAAKLADELEDDAARIGL